MVEISGVSEQAKIEYKLFLWNGSDFRVQDWTEICPTVTDVYDAPVDENLNYTRYNQKRLYIHIIDGGKEYWTQEKDQITSNDTEYFKAKIYPKNLSDQDIEVTTVESPVYDPNVSGGKDDMKSLITVKYKGQKLDDRF